MALDLAAIVRTLEAVEARYPETTVDLAPVIQALTGPDAATVGTEQARKLLGVRSVNTVKRWIALGILAGRWDERSGRWQIPLADVLRLRARQAAHATAGGDELTPDELAELSATATGDFPWQRPG